MLSEHTIYLQSHCKKKKMIKFCCEKIILSTGKNLPLIINWLLPDNKHIIMINFVSISQKQVPFDTYFKVNKLVDYLRVITMEKFMAELAPKIWPKGDRAGRSVVCRTHSGLFHV